ncbi:nuclear transport factor 2 family protein [Maricaulis sp.]|uniref:nuclear transport factor 2 family protein n=1 Tax=Maricaulis sp. TaxID=1486257 RepID=UPI003A8DE533
MSGLRAGLCLIVLAATPAWGQGKAGPVAAPDLDARFAELDRQVFELGYNGCDLDLLAQLTSEGLEFYHDVGGVTLGRAAFIDSIDNNICRDDFHVTRTLVPGSLVLHPLYDNGVLYGAVQSGEHLFSIVRPGEAPELTGRAGFTTLWRLEGDDWRMSRVLSYDHQPISEADGH